MPSEESFKLIEGDWKDFRFRRVLPADYDAVLNHLANNYMKDEPTSNLLGWSQEYADNINRLVRVILDDGLSFLAEHIPSGKVAGVRVTLHRKLETNFDHIPIECRKAQMFIKYVGDICTMADVVNKEGINTWAEFYMASTTREFRNQGLAGEFYDRSVAFLKAEGFKHAVVVVTSPYTKKATLKRGFKELCRLDYKDFVDFDGKRVFKDEELNSEHYGLVRLITL